MGEAKRRRQILGDKYGAFDVNNQAQKAWSHIHLAIKNAQINHAAYLLVQCTNNDKGFHYDTINLMKNELSNWHCPVDIPVLIQMLPAGFSSSKVKLFDGYMTVWCNNTEIPLWQELFNTHIHT